MHKYLHRVLYVIYLCLHILCYYYRYMITFVHICTILLLFLEGAQQKSKVTLCTFLIVFFPTRFQDLYYAWRKLWFYFSLRKICMILNICLIIGWMVLQNLIVHVYMFDLILKLYAYDMILFELFPLQGTKWYPSPSTRACMQF